MKIRPIFFAIVGFTWLLVSAGAARAQVVATIKGPQSLALRRIERVHLKEHDLSRVLQTIALDYAIPIGFEVSRDEVTSPVALDFDGGPLTELMALIVRQNDLYEWQIQDEVLNVYPKDRKRNQIVGQMLDVRLDHFRIEPKTPSLMFSDQLFAAPELVNFFRSHRFRGVSNISTMMFGPALWPITQLVLGDEFSLEINHVTVRSLLDKIIKESPRTKFWSAGRVKYRSVSAPPQDTRGLRVSLGTAAEDPPLRHKHRR